MIGLVENAMLARLKAFSDAGGLGYTYRTLESWPVNFDEYLSSLQGQQYPCAWSAFAGAHNIDRVSRGRWRAHCAFGLVVAAKNVRNESSRRLGGAPGEVGSYQLAIDALTILGDQRLGLDIDPFRPESIVHVETGDIKGAKQISAYAVSFATGLYYDTLNEAEDITDFNSIHANWDPAPFGHVDADPNTPGVQIPDDVHAIGTDHVNLRETQ